MSSAMGHACTMRGRVATQRPPRGPRPAGDPAPPRSSGSAAIGQGRCRDPAGAVKKLMIAITLSAPLRGPERDSRPGCRAMYSKVMTSANWLMRHDAARLHRRSPPGTVPIPVGLATRAMLQRLATEALTLDHGEAENVASRHASRPPAAGGAAVARRPGRCAGTAAAGGGRGRGGPRAHRAAHRRGGHRQDHAAQGGRPVRRGHRRPPAWGWGWPGEGAPGTGPGYRCCGRSGLDDQLSREAGERPPPRRPRPRVSSCSTR